MPAASRRWYYINHQPQNERSVAVMLRIVKNFLADERGQASTEYAVIIGVVALVLIGVLIAFREELVRIFEDSTDELKGVTVPAS